MGPPECLTSLSGTVSLDIVGWKESILTVAPATPPALVNLWEQAQNGTLNMKETYLLECVAMKSLKLLSLKRAKRTLKIKTKTLYYCVA